MTERFRIRPMMQWDRPKTDPRKRGAFRVDWTTTLTQLDYEVGLLGGPGVIVVEIDANEQDIRRDGMLRSNARVGPFPGVRISFDSRHGPLAYASDTYEDWRHNVRAVALGLESLRAVDRYGITRTGEQYRGFTALSSKPAGDEALTVQDAKLVFSDALKRPITDAEASTTEDVLYMFRAAAKVHHPDVGGSEQVFKLLVRARDTLLAALR